MPRKSRNAKKNVNAASDALQKMVQMMSSVKMQPSAPKRPKPRRNRKARVSAVDAEGMITLSRKELVTTITSESNGSKSLTIALKPDSFKFLKNLGSSFERTRWLKMSFFYKPAVSMTSAGLVAMGVDWDSQSTKSTREDIAAYTPSSTFAVWQDTEKAPLILPPTKLQSRQWYMHASSEQADSGPGTLVISATGPNSSTLGELFVVYTVQMMGTKA
uniref:Capsid protein n=1 Tax=Chihuahua culicoides solemo-like virus 1 TaxID=3239315 RepID=A0AB39J8D1_9VIRU